jgi:transposase, IS30 family
VAGKKLAPELVRATLDALRSGMNPGQAGRSAGVSAEYARQLNKKMGGVYRPPGTSYDSRYLDREERYEIARLAEAGLSQRRIGARLGRSASTISAHRVGRGDGEGGVSMLGRRAERLAGCGGRRLRH